MKKYLFTWYGITDLRATLGFEKSGGPVLGAIKTKEYTDVAILGYTDPNKPEPSSKDKNREDYWRAYSNTDSAHTTFAKWLNTQIESESLNVNFNLYKIKLKKLNDTDGIYKAVSKVLDTISSKNEIEDITFFLSPGTPVMAFVWALTSLSNPSLKIKVIASSVPNNPPELISLPSELMKTGLPKKIRKTDHNNFDVIFHLFGEQRLPMIFAINHFQTEKHIFLNSKKYPADVMLNFLDEENFEQINVEPFDPKDVEAKILDRVAKMPKNLKIGFNLTGGTKLMYAGAMSAAKKVHGTPFYFESKNNNLIYLNNFAMINSKKIKNVETFFKINTKGLIISSSGKLDKKSPIYDRKRQDLSKELYKYKEITQTLYYDLSKGDKKSFSENHGKPFNINKINISASLSKEGNAKIKIYDKEFIFSKWLDIGEYLLGKWFEEYTYIQLAKLEKLGLIQDLRIGLELSLDKKSKTSDWQDQLRATFKNAYQEIDLCFTNNNTLYIIECKSGKKILSNDINKIENIRRLYGGNECKSILYTTFPLLHNTAQKRILDHPKIHFVHNKEIDLAVKEIISKD